MEQVQYVTGEKQRKTAYQLEYAEFTLLMKNLRRFGPLAETVIISSNDRSNKLKPRVQPVKEAVERLTEVLGEENADQANIGMNNLDVLRVERAEVTRAVVRSEASEIQKRKGTVVLGLATMAISMNVLRDPLMQGSPNLAEPERMREMFDQFHQEGVDRLGSQV